MHKHGPLIHLKDVTIGYKHVKLLESFSLEIMSSDFLSIVGSNGSGKTTLVKTILNLQKPLSGKVAIESGVTFGYVPQKSNTNMSFPLTVNDVVMHGRVPHMGLFRRPSLYDQEIVAKAIADVGIEKLSHHGIHTLSGGQYQRMLIARALASQPDILVFDEPTTGMDIVAEHSFIEMVSRLKTKLDLTVVMVTHDLSQAARISNKLIVINGRDKTLCVGSPNEVLTADRLTQLFHRPLHIVQNEGETSIVVDQMSIPKDEL